MYPEKRDNQSSASSRGGRIKYRLFRCVELIEEALLRYNRALIDESTAVDVIGIELEYTMPVLQQRKGVLMLLP